jgi:hypothetical protein
MRLLLCLAALLVLIGAPACRASGVDDDWQARYRLGASLDLGERWETGVFREYRVGRNPAGLDEKITDVGLSLNSGARVRLGLSYRQTDKESGEQWIVERRPYAHATVRWALWGLGFSDRSRLERRRWSSDAISWRYRNMLKVTMSSGWLDPFAIPYVAAEGFYSIDDDEYNRTRIYLGAKGRFGQLLSVDVYYIHQSQRSGDSWTTLHAFGLKVLGNL